MKLLQQALDKVKKIDRLQLLRQSTKKESRKIRLITHYNLPATSFFTKFYMIMQDCF